MRSYWVLVSAILLVAGCSSNRTAEFVESISEYSNYSTVDWVELSEKYYRPNSCDWGDSVESGIAEGLPMELAGYYWHILQNARTDFHKKSLSLRSNTTEDVVDALDKAESMFDTVFVKCVSQEYYMRLFPEVYNEVMKSAIDELVEQLNGQNGY